MKQVLIPTIVLTGLSMSTIVAGDYVGLSGDINGVSIEGELYAVIRVYANFTSTTDQLNAVFGDDQNELYITSNGAGFYQHPFGGPTSPSINPAFFPLFPSLEYDSWVTIGNEDQVDNAMLDVGIDWSIFEGGGDIETNNGAWFATPDDPQVLAGEDLRVLIGQFTSYGNTWSHTHFMLNLQGKVGDSETFVARDQYLDVWIPTPASITLICLAGLFNRRRR